VPEQIAVTISLGAVPELPADTGRVKKIRRPQKADEIDLALLH